MAPTRKPMTKTQIIAELAERHDLPKKAVAAFMEDLATLAVDEAKKTGSFNIPGIGKLVKQRRKARIGRNPQTGEAIKIPAKTVAKFRVAKAAKDAIL